VGEISVRGLKKTFVRAGGLHVAAVDDVSLDVAPGEVVVLLGPSGCGKTTLLRCIAGLETPTSGTVQISGRVVYSGESNVRVPPEQRRVSMMFQSYALWPHMTVSENVAYPLKAQRIPRAERGAMVSRALERVGIAELADQYPNQLSGGQQQRVALARCLVVRPSVVLFDEPLSNVDAKVREQLRLELIEMQRELQYSAIYVTHDQEEAMQIAHRIAVMKAGRVVQIGTCEEIYTTPATRYVANFVGSVNELPGILSKVGSTSVVRAAIGQVQVASERISRHAKSSESVVAYIRPEDVRLTEDTGNPTNVNEWVGTVSTVMFLGAHTEYVVAVGGCRLRVWDGSRRNWKEGSRVRVTLPPESVGVLPPEDLPVEESAA
jgi:iron(III) transport system ATP-binding protein